MKILVISNMYPSKKVPNYGTFVKNFCDQLQQIDIDHDKVVMNKETNKLNKISKYLFYYIRVTISILLKSYDLIYVHYASHNAFLLLLLSKIKKINIYTNVHGGDVVPQTKTQKGMQKYTKKLLGISKRIIVPSKYFKELMIKRYNIPENKIFIYPSAGVNESLFYPYGKGEKKEFIIDDIKLERKYQYIGFVGRIEQGKGWDTFLSAVSILKNKGQFNNKKAIIIGNGVEYDKFLRRIQELNLSRELITIKALPQEKLPDIYNILSVFCFPTEREGESLGLVALETLACGVPVIASNFAAPKDYIIDNYNGYKFEKGNPKDLADKIEKFFKLPTETVKLFGENANLIGSNYYSSKLKTSLKSLFRDTQY